MADQTQSPKPQHGTTGKPQSDLGGAVQTSGSRGQERLHGVMEMGSVGRDVPDQSKERSTEIAVQAGHKNGEHREIAMQEQPDRDRIAEEAVGQKRDSAPPYVQNAGEESSRQFPASSEVASSIPEKSAASVGERVGNAYSDPEREPQYSSRPNIGQQIAGQGEANKGVDTGRFVSASEKAAYPDQERFLTVIASFALGYLAGVLFHDRIIARFNTTSGPFQITKPPTDKHPRGFVQATVLKTISEHPQGMTSGEITNALGSQGIDQRSTANALSALIQAKKITSEGRRGKYHSAAAEVPTAPDLPSS
ncbi:MAG: hypothetical protein JOZ62_04740 [Acidobacteriaceae bacterium]|nr:hypothetical protein [Acidobacteriaceae bacterium]